MEDSNQRHYRPPVRNLWTWVYALALLFSPTLALDGQVTLSREYIRLGGKVVAIENIGTPPGGGPNVRVDAWPGSSSLGLNQQLQFHATARCLAAHDAGESSGTDLLQ